MRDIDITDGSVTALTLKGTWMVCSCEHKEGGGNGACESRETRNTHDKQYLSFQTSGQYREAGSLLKRNVSSGGHVCGPKNVSCANVCACLNACDGGRIVCDGGRIVCGGHGDADGANECDGAFSAGFCGGENKMGCASLSPTEPNPTSPCRLEISPKCQRTINWSALAIVQSKLGDMFEGNPTESIPLK